ncbi:MAG: DeoR/GlpR transcriptional regulator [Clostridia bacterium]|nr:DeoR/GlpR transcriptional regulator [Clostridia bacterium]
MIDKDRQKQILDILDQQGAVSVKKLTAELYVSEATVRRDLCELEKMGMIKRTFGGAVPVSEVNRQIPLLVRESMNSAAKNEICRRASALIKDGDVIFLDGSSTAQYMVKYLKRFSDLVVVTNGLKVAELLSDLPEIKTYCTGGQMVPNSLVFIGRHAESMAANLNIDICFFSCRGLNEKGVFSDSAEHETNLRRHYLACSKKRIFLMTGDKIGKTYMHILCHANEVDYVISDGQLPESLHLRSCEANL